MKFQKLAIASAAALLLASVGTAQAQSVSGDTQTTNTPTPGVTPPTPTTGNIPTTNTSFAEMAAGLTDILNIGRLAKENFTDNSLTSKVYSPVDITALAGAVNLNKVNGSIDISGANVSITGISGTVEAKASAVGTTSNATAFAINGNNFSTTVIGAMNSATLDVMGKLTDQSAISSASLGVNKLSATNGQVTLATPSIAGDKLTGIAGDISSINVLGGANKTSSSSGTTPDVVMQLNVEGLMAESSSHVTNKVNELQNMNAFNMAINAADIDASVKIAAKVDDKAWFLNPQTGVVNLSNLQLATTAIGAMNSSVTRLGANLAK